MKDPFTKKIKMIANENVVFEANHFGKIQGAVKASRQYAGLAQGSGQAAQGEGRIHKRRERHGHEDDVTAAGNR